MKPLHIGLLVVGAVLAGGLAFRLTQPVPIADVAPVIPPIVHLRVPAPPVVVRPPMAKPSPIPAVRATAPEPIYTLAPREPAKTAIRKDEPISVARIKPAQQKPPQQKPTQWVPGRYESSSEPASVRRSAAPSAPVVVAAIEKSAAPMPAPAVERITSPAPQAQQAQQAPPAPRRQATLRIGISIPIRLDEPLSSDFSPTGSTFQGSLIEPLVADGFVIAERGAPVAGRIVESQKAGRSAGMSRLKLELTNLTTSDGQHVAIATDPWMKLGDGMASHTAMRFRLASTVTLTEQQIAGK
jgi:hypothetical protein